MRAELKIYFDNALAHMLSMVQELERIKRSGDFMFFIPLLVKTEIIAQYNVPSNYTTKILRDNLVHPPPPQIPPSLVVILERYPRT